jgi:hypothetical protein
MRSEMRGMLRMKLNLNNAWSIQLQIAISWFFSHHKVPPL